MVGRFVNFHQAHIFATGNRYDNALCTLHRHAVEQWVGDGLFRSFERAAVAFGFTSAHHCLAHFVHDRTDVGKVEVDEAGHNHQVRDATNALLQHFVSKLERFLKCCVRVGDQEQILVWNNDQRINMLLQFDDTRFCGPHAARTFEHERLGYDTDRQNIHFARNLGDNRSSARSGAAAHTSRDKAHVATGKRHFHLLKRFFSRSAANFGA